MAGIDLAPGARVAAGRYTLERMLGSGGMASVWLAHDDRLDRPVAVKLMSDVLALDPSFVQRFRREARLAAQLWHPNLVQVYDFDIDRGRPLLVMEVVHGPTLAGLLREPAPGMQLEPPTLAVELLRALAHIHNAGVVHRDVKPANVLLGEDGRARLTDFGVAQPTGATSLTMTGDVVGTVGYLAPEVARGERATPRSDLYSCGVVLAACNDKWGRHEPQLERLIAQLTADAPRQRPRSATDALARLDGAAATRTRQPTSPTAIAPKRRPRPGRPLDRRHATGVVAGVVLVLIAVVLIAVVLLASGGGGGGGASGGGGGGAGATSRPQLSHTVPPPSAPLSNQLDALSRDIEASAR